MMIEAGPLLATRPAAEVELCRPCCELFVSWLAAPAMAHHPKGIEGETEAA